MSDQKKFGIIQGRLTPSPPGELQWFPQEKWRDEFALAAQLGYGFIELIAERNHNEDNPLWSDQGVQEIKDLCAKNSLNLYAFCNDYIIDHSLINDPSSMKESLRLIDRGALLNLKVLVLPFFEHSEINMDNIDQYKKLLIEQADYAQEKGIKICLETILNGKELTEFLESMNHTNISCVFDTGNRIAFGHDIYSDIRLLNKHIEHVHIKDKNEQNENVLLGTGKVDFKRVAEALSDIEYDGAYTFETHRGKDPLRTAEYNKYIIEYFTQEAVMV